MPQVFRRMIAKLLQPASRLAHFMLKEVSRRLMAQIYMGKSDCSFLTLFLILFHICWFLRFTRFAKAEALCKKLPYLVTTDLTLSVACSDISWCRDALCWFCHAVEECRNLLLVALLTEARCCGILRPTPLNHMEPKPLYGNTTAHCFQLSFKHTTEQDNIKLCMRNYIHQYTYSIQKITSLSNEQRVQACIQHNTLQMYVTTTGRIFSKTPFANS